MSNQVIYQRQCQDCQQLDEHPNQILHHHHNVFLSGLNEQQRRLYVALEAQKLGHGGTKQMSQMTGMHVNTIRRGRREWEDALVEYPNERIRQPGGGRLPIEKKT